MNRPRLNAKIIAIAKRHDLFRDLRTVLAASGAHFVGIAGLPIFTRHWSVWDAVLLLAEGYSVERAARSAATFDVKLVVVVTAELEAMRDALWKIGTRSRVLVLRGPASESTIFEAVRRGLPAPRGSG
jgi:hypothetical protein